MDLISILVSLLRAGWPLPDFNDEAAVKTWLDGLTPTLASIIARLTPDERASLLAPQAAGDDLWEAVEAELPGRIGDGTILRWLKENGPAILNIIMTIIAFIPKTQPAPTPAPGPVT
jgi:hypothetical protein